ncbi:MAG: putative asparagine synthetase [glutamine-hydrolyzing] [Chlamydiae bacterium]|nr:putative asparagine synthetase [glutamine-hydrolyzing] [Chlamydiota bacterium]
MNSNQQETLPLSQMEKIAGIISDKKADLNLELDRMLSTMHQPHPYEKKPHLQQENIFVGVSPGHFFSNVTKTLHIAIDGEILNLDEIKQKLLESGQVIGSDKMQDLIITAFQTWGPKCFKFFNGPFIILIFDQKQKKIILARDRLGSKSLFWGKFENGFLFSCQLKGILASTLVPQSPNLNAIASYFFIGYFPQDKTPICNVNRLLPGYYLEVDQNQNIDINKYWSFKSFESKETSRNQEEVNEELQSLMDKAVKQRLSSNKKTGCLLSDDIGSTALAHFLKRNSSDDILSFSTGFEGNTSNDHAERDAKYFGFKHNSHQIKPEEILDNLQHVIWHLDEPVADPNAMAIWQVANLAKKNSCSIFSGLGSYEFLGSRIGQGNIAYEPVYLWLLYLSKPLFLKGAIPLLSKFSKKASLKSLRFFQTDFWALEYIKQQALFTPRSLKKIAPSLHGLFDISLFLQQSYQYLKFILYQDFKVEDYLFFDAETSLSNCLLVQYEKIFASQGVNFYSPYFDKNVMEFLFSVPETMKFKGKKEALPLHMILQNEFKAEDLTGFPSRSPWFLSNWMNHPKLRSIFQMLTKGVLVESNIIDGKNLQKLLDEKNWKTHQFERVWSILVLEIWFRLFVNNPIYSYPEKDQSLEDFLKKEQSFLI